MFYPTGTEAMAKDLHGISTLQKNTAVVHNNVSHSHQSNQTTSGYTTAAFLQFSATPWKNKIGSFGPL